MARYIDADKLMESMIKGLFPNEKTGTPFDVLRTIEQTPTADVVEVKHGEWKPTEPDSDVRFFCSECETEISTSWDYDNAEMWRYCPNCGAKMDGRSDTDDR